MRQLAPMTMIVVLVLAVCLIGGIIMILRSARNERPAAVGPTCPRCATANRARARFCAHCGGKIES